MSAGIRSLLKPEYVVRPSQLLRRLVRGLVPFPAGEVRERLPWGAELLVEPRGGSVGRSVWLLGLHDLLVCESLWRLADPGVLAVDGGANIGQMTTLLRRRVGARGRVVAFEPHPEIAARLERNVAESETGDGLGEVEIRQQALDATPGRRLLYEGSDFASELGTATLRVSDGRAIPVETTTLDEVFPVEALGIVKLDLEGGEEQALIGADRLLRDGRIRHLVFEADEQRIVSIRRRLEGFGYGCFSLAQDRRGPKLGTPDRWRGPAHVAPSFVASRAPGTVQARFEVRGWKCLLGSSEHD